MFWPFRNVSDTEQLGRLSRELGEALARHLERQPHSQDPWSELTVEFSRARAGDVPLVRGSVEIAGTRHQLDCPPETSTIGAALARLSDQHRGWELISIRFRPEQLPVPVGIGVRLAHR